MCLNSTAISGDENKKRQCHTVVCYLCKEKARNEKKTITTQGLAWD